MTPPLPVDRFPRLIKTSRLRLREPIRSESALYTRQAAQAYANRPEPLSEQRAAALSSFMIEHWDRYGFGFLVVDIIEDPRVPVTVGHIGFKYVDAWPAHWPENYEAIELGYSVIPAARGRGYVTEGARAALAAAFDAFDLVTIGARCAPDNAKSAAVLLRCGMVELAPSDRLRRFELTRAHEGAAGTQRTERAGRAASP